MQTSRLKIFTQISECVTLKQAARKKGQHIHTEDLSIVRDAALVTEGEKILWLGSSQDLQHPEVLAQFSNYGGLESAERISLGNRCVIPGFVECHTHLIHQGTRAEEFEWRNQGVTYQEIAKRGGGILSTVKATRLASHGDLKSTAQKRVNEFLRQGVTTLEIKTGYGLDLDTELRCLNVARELSRAKIGPRIVTTYLGLHAKPPEFLDHSSYVDYVCNKVLPHIAEQELADRVDVYIEDGFFNLAQAKQFFETSRNLGFAIAAHVEQLSAFGGAQLGLEFSAQSLDHLVFAEPQIIAKLSKSQTTAVLLPTSDFYLQMRYPPAREMLDQGVRVALSTDFNPGTSPTQDLSFLGVLARLKMKLSRAEVLTGLTINAAFALGLEAECGSLEVGKRADFVVLNDSWEQLFYQVGYHPIYQVYRGSLNQSQQ